MLRRSLLVAIAVAVTWPGLGRAEGLTEAEVIRLARAQDPDAIAAREAVAIAEASRIEAALYPNPSLAWDREHLTGESEDTVALTIPIDLSSRRSTREHLASAEALASGASAARVQSDVVVRAVNAFYRLIAEKERAEIEEHNVARLDEAVRVMRRRKEEGKASGYDQSRLEIEKGLASSSLRQTRARVEKHKAKLALLLGVDASSLVVSGSLASEDGRSPAVAKTEPSSVRLLRNAEEHARRATSAATRAWIPTLSLTGGMRIGVADETRYGYVVGAAIDLPIFSRGQELRARAGASQRQARARVSAAERAAEVRRVRAEQTLNASREEAIRFDEAVRDHVDRLVKAAESGYREGDRSIVELLDARRARTSVATRRLELAFSIKRAEIDLRAARGEFE